MIPKKEPTKTLSEDEETQFGNWTSQTDPKLKAIDLKKRGLVGAQQLIDDAPDIKNPDSIRHSQSDWKTAAIQQILSNSKKYNIRTPEGVKANLKNLVGNKDWYDAINSDSFKTIHPNFLDVVSRSILPEQHAKFDKSKNQTALNSAKSVDEFFKK